MIFPPSLITTPESPISPEVQERMHKAKKLIEKKHGTPVISPNWLLEHPIWHDPERATLHQGFSTTIYEAPKTYRPYPISLVIETHNDLTLTRCRENRNSAGGLLRWRDMDLAVAASRAWTEQGTVYLECYQREILAWMGYDENIPYREISGSLNRLRRTAISMYVDGTRKENISWFTLFKDCATSTDDCMRGNPTLIKMELSNAWLEALNSPADWTVFDLDCYAQLARANRRQGLARALYLYLAARRNYRDMTFNLQKNELIDSFADRRKIGEGRCYKNPFDKRSRLFRALKLLSDQSIIRWDNSKDQTISGIFCRPKNIVSLSSISDALCAKKGRQMSLEFDPGIFNATSSASAPLNEISPPPTELPKLAEETNRQITPKPVFDHSHWTAVKALRLLFPAIPTTDVESAISGGWTDNEIGHLIGYVKFHSDTIQNPEGFIISHLRKGLIYGNDRGTRWSKNGIDEKIKAYGYKDWMAWVKTIIKTAINNANKP